MAGYHYHYNFYLRFLVSTDNTQLLLGHYYMSFILVSFFVTVHSYRKKKYIYIYIFTYLLPDTYIDTFILNSVIETPQKGVKCSKLIIKTPERRH